MKFCVGDKSRGTPMRHAGQMSGLTEHIDEWVKKTSRHTIHVHRYTQLLDTVPARLRGAQDTVATSKLASDLTLDGKSKSFSMKTIHNVVLVQQRLHSLTPCAVYRA